jgi:hypothetical protein
MITCHNINSHVIRLRVSYEDIQFLKKYFRRKALKNKTAPFAVYCRG